MDAFSWLDKIFLFCSIIGGALFIARLVLMFLGADHGVDVHADVPSDVHVDFGGGHDVGGHDAGGHSDSVASFKLLTFQGITGFILMFGLTGLVVSLLARLGGFLSLLMALIAGVATMWVIAKFFGMLMGLQSEGTMDIKNAIGQEGTVYLRIPAGGTGKVQVSVQGRLDEFEATTDGKDELKSGEKIRVVFLKGNTLVVEKA